MRVCDQPLIPRAKVFAKKHESSKKGKKTVTENVETNGGLKSKCEIQKINGKN